MAEHSTTERTQQTTEKTEAAVESTSEQYGSSGGQVGLAVPPPPPAAPDNSANRLKGMPSLAMRQAALRTLQRQYGNSYASQVARSLRTPSPQPQTQPVSAQPPIIQRDGTKQAEQLKPAETITAISGTTQSFQQAHTLISLTAKERATQLGQVLRPDGAAKEGNLDTFNVVTSLLSSFDPDLKGSYQQMHHAELEADLITALGGLGTYTTRYLRDMLEKGEPSNLSQVARALGLVSSPALSDKEVLKLVQEASPEEFMETWDEFAEHFRKKGFGDKVKAKFKKAKFVDLGGSKSDRINTAFEFYSRENAAENLTSEERKQEAQEGTNYKKLQKLSNTTGKLSAHVAEESAKIAHSLSVDEFNLVRQDQELLQKLKARVITEGDIESSHWKRFKNELKIGDELEVELLGTDELDQLKLDKLAEPWDRNLAALVKQHTGTDSMDPRKLQKLKGLQTKKLFRDLVEWLPRIMEIEERYEKPHFIRDYILREDSRSTKTIKGVMFLSEGSRAKIDWMLRADKLPESLDPGGDADLDFASLPEEQQMMKPFEDTVAVYSLQGTLIRQGTLYEKRSWLMAYLLSDQEAVAKEIDNMTDQQRQQFVGLYLPESDHAAWMDQATPYLQKRGLLLDAMPKMIEDFKEAHLDKELILKIFGRLEHGSSAGPNYMSLKELARGKHLTKATGEVAFKLGMKLRGDEMRQVRNDILLLKELDQMVKDEAIADGTKYWERFKELIQLPPDFDMSKDKIDYSGTTSEVSQDIRDQIEYEPDYWAMLFHQELKTSDKDLVYGVAHRAQMAAKRLDAMHKADIQSKAPPSGASGQSARVRPYTIRPFSEFTGLILGSDQLKAEDRAKLEKKMPKAHKALTNPDFDILGARLNHAIASYGVTGRKPVKSAIVGSFEDMEGEELLKEWSNLPEYLEKESQIDTLGEQWVAKYDEKVTLEEEAEKAEKAGPPADPKLGLIHMADVAFDRSQIIKLDKVIKDLEDEMDEVREELSDFVPGIRADRLEYLEQYLNGRSRVEVEKQLTMKLYQAASLDTRYDPVLLEHLKFGMVMVEQHQKDSGLQFSKFSQASQSRKEGRNLYLSKFRTLDLNLKQAKTNGQSADEVEQIKSKGLGQIKVAESDLAERTKEFDKLRKKVNRIAKIVVSMIISSIVAAATAGHGLPLVTLALISMGAGIARETARELVNWATYGEAYEKKDLAVGFMVGVIKGAAGVGAAELFVSLDIAAETTPEALDQVAESTAFSRYIESRALYGILKGTAKGVSKETFKYFAKEEKPFRNFSKNSDTLIANIVKRITARELLAVTKGLVKAGLAEAVGINPGTHEQDGSTQEKMGVKATEVAYQDLAKPAFKQNPLLKTKKYKQPYKQMDNSASGAIEEQAHRERQVFDNYDVQLELLLIMKETLQTTKEEKEQALTSQPDNANLKAELASLTEQLKQLNLRIDYLKTKVEEGEDSESGQAVQDEESSDISGGSQPPAPTQTQTQVVTPPPSVISPGPTQNGAQSGPPSNGAQQAPSQPVLPPAAPVAYGSLNQANPMLYFQPNSGGSNNYRVDSANPGEPWQRVEQFCAYLATHWLVNGQPGGGLRFDGLDANNRATAVQTLAAWGANGLAAQEQHAVQKLGGQSTAKQTVMDAIKSNQHATGTRIWFGTNIHAQAAVKLANGNYNVYDPNTGLVTSKTGEEFTQYLTGNNAFVVAS